jgi:hypothetical protein
MSTATQLRLSLADHGRGLTLREFLDADEADGYRHEPWEAPSEDDDPAMA